MEMCIYIVIGLSHNIFMCNTIEVVRRFFAVNPAGVKRLDSIL